MKRVLYQLSYTSIMVPPPGIEPGSMDFQSTAMTTFAKDAWCSHRELNSELILTKDVLYHLTMRASPGICPCESRQVQLTLVYFTMLRA